LLPVVDTPQEYYTIMSLVDLIEFIYGLNKNNMNEPTRDNISTLGSQYPFHELNLDDGLSTIHIPKADKYKETKLRLYYAVVCLKQLSHIQTLLT